MLKFKSKISNYDQFKLKVDQVCRNINIQPEWLWEVMNIETAGSFSPQQKNLNGSSAVGLIQFMASTASWLGTSRDALLKMNNIQQMDYVEKYFKAIIKTVGTPRNFFDTYLIVFQPAWVGKPDESKLPDSAYKMNRGIDLNKDGIVTKGEFRQWAMKNIKGFSNAWTDTLKKV